MNATDELRKLLDERGVEYDTRDGNAVKNTYWNVGDLRFGYCEQIYEDGQHETDLFMYRGYGCTPAQAIAATLGADDGTRWHELFGTPERAAKTIQGGTLVCRECIIREQCAETPEDSDCVVMNKNALLEWLLGKVVS